jgi:hypothetical protein
VKISKLTFFKISFNIIPYIHTKIFLDFVLSGRIRKCSRGATGSIPGAVERELSQLQSLPACRKAHTHTHTHSYATFVWDCFPEGTAHLQRLFPRSRIVESYLHFSIRLHGQIKQRHRLTCQN